MDRNTREFGGFEPSSAELIAVSEARPAPSMPIELCLWSPSRFTVTEEYIETAIGNELRNPSLNRITFYCAEQFVQYCRARYHCNSMLQGAILATKNLETLLRIKNNVDFGYCHKDWDRVKHKVLMAANIAKFRQNPLLKRALLDLGEQPTASKILMTFSRGTDEENMAWFGDKNIGANQPSLGRVLRLVRRDLIREMESMNSQEPTQPLPSRL